MAIPTIKAGARYYRVNTKTPTLPGYPFIELGPAGTNQQVSTMMVQLNPNEAWSGSLIVVGRLMGVAANEVDVPFEPIPYRVGSLNNVAQISAAGHPWPGSIAPITGPAIIQIPASGLSIAFLVEVLAGQMDITSWDLQGSAVT